MTPTPKPMVEEGGVWWRLHDNGLSVEFEFRDPQDGEIEISGHHKWDGCVDWETSSTCMMHFCGMEAAERLLRLFIAVAMIAKREIGTRYDVQADWPGAYG
jgi:uncharacterized protein YxjI